MYNEPSNNSYNKTLLIVDDDKLILNMLTDFFSEKGYRIITAEDGKKAVDEYKMSSEKIDLILMDVIMPNKDGLTASTEILAHDPNAVIFLMSGFCYDDIKSISGSNFIRKPFSPTEVMEKIRYHLNHEIVG